MDDFGFDRLSKVLGAAPTRRTALGLAAGAALGGLAGLLGLSEAGAKGKTRGKGKKKKKGKKPQGERCGKAICRLSQSCCGGRCVDPLLCCVTTEDCNGCQVCVGGLCETDPSRNGVRCSDCLECADGDCEVPNNDFCQDNQICRPANGQCCPKCRNGECCEIGEVCIKPGGSGSNTCCNTARNEPCGSNGDGTYRECCESDVEECVQGTCELKIPCPGGRLTAEGLCCTEGRVPCSGPSGPFCAPAGHKSCGDTSCDDSSQVCCDPAAGVCCTRGRCAGGECCSDNRRVCGDRCVDTQTDRRHCGRCDSWCDGPGLECCNGSCKTLLTDEENCGACGNVCNPRSEVCHEGECREICSLNPDPDWRNPCDDGVDHWCCPSRSTTCCRLSGRPHCC